MTAILFVLRERISTISFPMPVEPPVMRTTSPFPLSKLHTGGSAFHPWLRVRRLSVLWRVLRATKASKRESQRFARTWSRKWSEGPRMDRALKKE